MAGAGPGAGMGLVVRRWWRGGPPLSGRQRWMSDGHEHKRALVTGATRGIGKATAVALAESGWDVAITGRTVREGDGRDDSDTGGGRALPGSLEGTASSVSGSGRRGTQPDCRSARP